MQRRVGPTLLWVVAVFGAGTMVFGMTHSYVVAFLALVVLSAADMVSMYIRGSIVPLVTPDDQLGRVSAVEGVFIGASNELGAFESGVTARAFGLPWAIAGGGFLTIVVAGSFAVLFPSLRRIDTFDELDPKRARTRSTRVGRMSAEATAELGEHAISPRRLVRPVGSHSPDAGGDRGIDVHQFGQFVDGRSRT